MVQFGTREPLQPGDPRDVMIRDIGNIIERYRALGDTEVAGIYQTILDKLLEK